MHILCWMWSSAIAIIIAWGWHSYRFGGTTGFGSDTPPSMKFLARPLYRFFALLYWHRFVRDMAYRYGILYNGSWTNHSCEPLGFILFIKALEQRHKAQLPRATVQVQPAAAAVAPGSRRAAAGHAARGAPFGGSGAAALRGQKPAGPGPHVDQQIGSLYYVINFKIKVTQTSMFS